MALQLGIKRSLLSSQSQKISVLNGITDVAARRYKSTDVGDVIGIDLGTTNSCVAIMVCPLPRPLSNPTTLTHKSTHEFILLYTNALHACLFCNE
jgi:hypothetical protein